MPVTDPERQREYLRAHRARNLAAGLTTNGTPRKRWMGKGSCWNVEQYWTQTRHLALEAITWMALKRRSDTAHLLGVAAFGANLPLKWWEGRDGHSINSIIAAIEREMETPCQAT